MTENEKRAGFPTRNVALAGLAVLSVTLFVLLIIQTVLLDRAKKERNHYHVAAWMLAEGHVHREGLDAALADADAQFAEMKKADEAWPAIAQARIREWEKLEDPEQRELRLQREAHDAASRAASEARRQRRGTDEPW